MAKQEFNDDGIHVEFGYDQGLMPINRPGEILELSTRATDQAMITIRTMSRKLADTMKSLSIFERPENLEVEFAIKLNSEGQAVISKLGADDFHLVVRMSWVNEDQSRD